MSLLSTAEQDSFLDAMQYMRLQAHKTLDLNTDGKFHRYRVEGDKSGSENGWYVLRCFGDIAVGSFGSWKTGDWTTWCSKKDSEFTPQEREVWRREQAAMKQARAAELLIVREKAAKKAAYLWNKADFAVAIPAFEPLPGDAPARVHPYILAKGVKPYGVKQMKTGLMVPLRNASGVLTSLQFIQPDGSKKFLTGGEVVGSYFAIGRHDSILCICEGFATGASIREASGFAVAVAFNAGNLLAVARLMREKFPDYTIIICADNDVETDGNPGLSKAAEAAEQIGGMFTFVKFQESELIDGKVPTDFNDLHRLRGLDAVREAVEAVAFDEPKPPVVPVEPVVQDVKPRLTIKDFEKLIDDSDDFDWLTDVLLGMLAVADLKRPAVEFLVARAAKKAEVPKSSLMEVLTSYSGDSGKGKGKKEDDGRVDELNHKHAILPVGGRVLIMNRDYDPVMERQLLTFSAKTDFETRYCNRKVWDDARHEEVGLGTYWLNHPRRAEFEGMVFSPGQDQPGYLNLWTGWGIEPAEGSCQRYLDFVLDVICSGNGDLFTYIIYWCAHLVQRPQEKPETALVFRGREGIGKDTFIKPLQDIVGREHFLMLSSLNQITGRFSGHLANALLAFCNESVWGGDKSAQGVLKSLITDPVQPIEHKGRDLMMIMSYLRVMVATNENWAVPRGADDRRYVVVDVSDAKKGDFQYFKAIKDEMAAGGTAALMHYLMNWDISGWHPRQIPGHLQTCGWELKIRSGGSVVQWWAVVLQQGWLLKDESLDGKEKYYSWPTRMVTGDLQACYLRYCHDYKITHPEHPVEIGRLLKDWGIRKTRPRNGGGVRSEFYLLPSLEQAQEIFSQRFSIPLDVWDGVDEEETAA